MDFVTRTRTALKLNLINLKKSYSLNCFQKVPQL